jgi:hypothetical protein
VEEALFSQQRLALALTLPAFDAATVKSDT